ncbi:5' nucleotidase, NT5C type [Sphingomicrobium flavum]|uniref:5' nucleotidase, NT5C type n=1 Tax=Sphingomicrobium flavum TaxID=1229164 RepID=UPI0021ADE854|nr:hypothetical protein [Sphingomicrobium flavum]
MTRRLFLDVDGVLADFDGGVRDLLGMGPDEYEARHGRGSFWKHLARADGFYANLDLLPGAMAMVDAVRHLQPTLLTGLPMGDWAAPQKRRWADRHFPDLKIITCMARDKWKYAAPGDVLVDDMVKARAPWKERASGVFIHHRSPEETLAELSKYFPL